MSLGLSGVAVVERTDKVSSFHRHPTPLPTPLEGEEAIVLTTPVAPLPSLPHPAAAGDAHAAAGSATSTRLEPGTAAVAAAAASARREPGSPLEEEEEDEEEEEEEEGGEEPPSLPPPSPLDASQAASSALAPGEDLAAIKVGSQLVSTTASPLRRAPAAAAAAAAGTCASKPAAAFVPTATSASFPSASLRSANLGSAAKRDCGDAKMTAKPAPTASATSSIAAQDEEEEEGEGEGEFGEDEGLHSTHRASAPPTSSVASLADSQTRMVSSSAHATIAVLASSGPPTRARERR